MKKLYVLILSAMLVLGIGATTLAMDTSVYFGGCASYTLASDGTDWDLALDHWAGGLWGNATGLMWEFYGSAKLADNCSLNITFGEWWSPEWPFQEWVYGGDDDSDGVADANEFDLVDVPWDGIYVSASFKLTDIFNLLTVEFTGGSNKAKDQVSPLLGGENFFHKGDPIIRVSAPLADGFNAALSLATDGGEFDYMLVANYAGDAFKLDAGYRADGAAAVEGAITAIEGLKIEAGYGTRGWGDSCYFVQGTFTGIEGLSIIGKYKHMDGYYGPYKGYWDVYPSALSGFDRFFEGWGDWDFGHFTYYGAAATYQMDALTIGGNFYMSDEYGQQYQVSAEYALADNLKIGGFYRSVDTVPVIVGYVDFLFGGATLEVWAQSVDGDVAYGLTMSACAW